MRTFLLVVVVVAVSFLFSCDTRYRDVSTEPEHAARIGEICEVLHEVYAQGFTLDLARKDLTHAVSLTPFRIAGPEITFALVIPTGTMVEVVGVRECWNCPFERIDYAVKLPEVERLQEHRVFARAVTMTPENVRCTKRGAEHGPESDA